MQNFFDAFSAFPWNEILVTIKRYCHKILFLLVYKVVQI
jgi:hypothetical protein